MFCPPSELPATLIYPRMTVHAYVLTELSRQEIDAVERRIDQHLGSNIASFVNMRLVLGICVRAVFINGGML